eukprot:3617208-Rhodomonas_salina.1
MQKAEVEIGLRGYHFDDAVLPNPLPIPSSDDGLAAAREHGSLPTVPEQPDLEQAATGAGGAVDANASSATAQGSPS